VGDADDILAICALHLGEAEAEALVAWIAERLGRPAVLAGDRTPPERLAHVVTHWLSAGQRSDLAGWLSRRAALGQPLVPPRAPGDGRGR
jgi:hypothetical protein